MQKAPLSQSLLPLSLDAWKPTLPDCSLSCCPLPRGRRKRMMKMEEDDEEDDKDGEEEPEPLC